jgi:basic membrane protein A and related proteins
MGRESVAIWIMIALISIAPLSSGYYDQPDKKNVKIIHFINGAVGDKSFFDSAVRGIAEAEEDFPLEVTTIEAGYDATLWKRTIEDAASNKDYDIMIAGTTPMLELLEDVAKMHPDKKFIIYDSCVNYTNGSFSNVYSILYRQNEGAYLAGVYAGLMTKSNIIGILGGQNSTIINDFVIGYEQGARSVNPDIDILVLYAESWNDSPKGEALAKDMYAEGADIVFQVAGTTGLGVFQAALNSDKYAIGVDSDQAQLIEKTDIEQAKHIPTSMMKNVDKSLYRALKLYMDSQLPFGRAETLGIKEEAVGLAKSKYYQEITPADVKAKINQTEIDIIDCRIKVETAFKDRENGKGQIFHCF